MYRTGAKRKLQTGCNGKRKLESVFQGNRKRNTPARKLKNKLIGVV
jgi:hypothetical protein